MSVLSSARDKLFERIIGRYISDRAVYKVFTDAFVVMVTARLAYASSTMIDGLMISNFLSTDAVAGYTLVYPVIYIMAVLSNLLALGMQSLLSSHIGKAKYKEADHLFTTVAILGTILSLAFTCLGYIFIEQFVILFGGDKSSPVLYGCVKDYLAGMLFGTLPMVLREIIVPVLQINGDSKRIKLCLLVSTIFNVIMNFLAIFVFRNGLWGIGLGTSLSQWVSLIVVLTHFTRKKLLCRFRFGKFDSGEIKKVFVFGLPMATQRICTAISPVLLNRCILALGSSVLVASVGIAQNVHNLLLVPNKACFLALNMSVGIYYAERDKTALLELTKVSSIFSLTVNTFLSVLFFILSPLLISIYTPRGTEVYSMAVSCLRWCCIGAVISAVNEHYRGLMLGLGRRKQVHTLTTLQMLVFKVASAWIFGLLFGVPGLLASFAFTELLSLSYILVQIYIKSRRFPRSLDDILLLPDDFEIPSEENFSLSVDSPKDVSTISRQIEAFCIAQGVDSRRALYTSICAEEMAANIAEYGFVENKKCSLSIRIWYQNDELTLRLRDNCKLFDIREQYETSDRRDIYSNVGIRMVMNMAREVTYVNSFNINNTTIKL